MARTPHDASPRGALDREPRASPTEDEQAAARRRKKLQAQAREFLDGLPRLVRRVLTHDPTLTLKDWREYGALKEWRARCVQGGVHDRLTVERDAYERILIQDPQLWRAHCRHYSPAERRLREYILRGRVTRRGARKKAPGDRTGALVTRHVEEATQHLSKGYELRREMRAAGGAASDDTEITARLRTLSYDDDACRAILRSKRLLGAAVLLVARQLKRAPTSIRSSLRRFKRSQEGRRAPRLPVASRPCRWCSRPGRYPDADAPRSRRRASWSNVDVVRWVA